MTSTSCVAKRPARPIIHLQLLLKFTKRMKRSPRSSRCGSFLYRAMCRLIRVQLVSVPLLFVFLVAPSAFAQSWISAVTANKTTTTATITWTTAVPANSQITYGTTTSYGSISTLNSNLVTTHSVTLTPLTAGTTYHYRVLSANSNGVLVTGLDNVFTTLAAAAISVSVSPTTATVASGGTQQFSAQVTNTSNTAVTWSATPVRRAPPDCLRLPQWPQRKP